MSRGKKLTLVIEVDDKGTPVVRGFDKATEKALKNTKKSVDDLNKSTGSSIDLWKKLGVTLGGFVGFRMATAGIKDLLDHSAKEEKALLGLETVMRSMGRYTPKLYKEMVNLASALQQSTTYGNEATLQGMKFLATYGDITDDLLPRTTRAMLDLAALMEGDTVRAANMLGKASMGMTGELRRVGITVDADTYKAKGYVGVLEQIEQQVHGQAEAMRRTGWGGLEAFGNVIGDVKEQGGRLIELKMGDTIEAWTKAFEDLHAELKETVDEKDWENYADEVTDAISRVDKELEPLPPEDTGWFGRLRARIKRAREIDEMVHGYGGRAAVMMRQVARQVPGLEDYYGGEYDLEPPEPKKTSREVAREKEIQDAIKEYEMGILAERAEALEDFYTTKQDLFWETARQEMEMADKIRDYEMERLAERAEALEDFYSVSTEQHTAALEETMANEEAMKEKRIQWAQDITGGMAGVFEDLAQAGGTHSKKMFGTYKAFKIAESIISAHTAAVKTMAEIPGLAGQIMAGIIYAKAMLQVAAIKKTKPPSYDTGGVSTTPGYYFAGVPEAHIPLQSGGSVPVQFQGPAAAGGITVLMKNPVFQDVDTLRNTMAEISRFVTRKEAPGAVVASYLGDGQIRTLSRSGY